VKCWERGGVIHLPRGDADILNARRSAVQVELARHHPVLAGSAIRTVCDPFPLSRVFGDRRCVSFLVAGQRG
jgi:hypothetical protein